MSIISKQPEGTGVRQPTLSGCPGTPNCVSSMDRDEEHSIEPIAFEGDWEEAMERLRRIVDQMPRTTVVTSDGPYLHVECRTLVFRFVDDVEFLANPDRSAIEVRSASRAGHSDMGVNRRRVEKIRTKFNAS